ncbi:DsrE/DsrF/TusD sulfur relay family protein [Nitratifractor salsuginis]|uniref:DsrE family protein n=1 Tax=Nitratifractor salsuginis (strain DSM 16511 / JCM 12458 / E9I37-1) TaxID=749222 RepID=E6X205_NITSE|nr:DsrE family protein [Nitratifractor salsuginis]ADV47074.1 DsrE family protein [Nitratifractor salsuginis DSM 16511]
MKVLIVFNHQPYDGSDVAWNGLRLARNLHERGEEVRIFLMNDSVDLARECTLKPESYDHDLVAMLKELYADGVALKVCGTCQARCGIHKNEPYFAPEVKGTMNDLSDWVLDSYRVLSF